MANQETEGLLSPIIRDIRLKQVARSIRPGSTVLDLACGAGYLKEFLPINCTYLGVDRIEPQSLDCFDSFIALDISTVDFEARISSWLPKQPDAVSLIAFVEHVKNPKEIVAMASRLVKPGGIVALTTPHPRGRAIHDRLASLGLLSKAGADEHEDFLGEPELTAIAQTVSKHFTYRQFLFGLNQIVTITIP